MHSNNQGSHCVKFNSNRFTGFRLATDKTDTQTDRHTTFGLVYDYLIKVIKVSEQKKYISEDFLRNTCEVTLSLHFWYPGTGMLAVQGGLHQQRRASMLIPVGVLRTERSKTQKCFEFLRLIWSHFLILYTKTWCQTMIACIHKNAYKERNLHKRRCQPDRRSQWSINRMFLIYQAPTSKSGFLGFREPTVTRIHLRKIKLQTMDRHCRAGNSWSCCVSDWWLRQASKPLTTHNWPTTKTSQQICSPPKVPRCQNQNHIAHDKIPCTALPQSPARGKTFSKQRPFQGRS